MLGSSNAEVAPQLQGTWNSGVLSIVFTRAERAAESDGDLRHETRYNTLHRTAVDTGARVE